MEKAWEKFEHDHAHAFEVLGQAALDASDAAATEAGIVPPGGADADKATGTQQTLDDLRRKGLPILSGGTPVSEGNPMPVKVIGQVQTAPNVNADSSSGSATGGDGSQRLRLGQRQSRQQPRQPTIRGGRRRGRPSRLR